MKLKKIIALAVCAMLALSSVASATIDTDEDGWYVQDTEPTSSSISARPVSITPSVEKILRAEAQTAGIAVGKQTTGLNDTNTDFYKITITVNNIGELYSAYDINSDYSSMWHVKLNNIAISIPGISAIIKEGDNRAVTTSTFEGKSWTLGGDGLQLTYGSTGLEAYPYANPMPEAGLYVANPEISVVGYYAVNKDAVLNVQPTVKVTYSLNKLTAVNATGVGTTNVVFGSSTVDVASVTISGATNATVGDNVQLSATVLPDNATDKTVTWAKVSGNGAVSDSGVVTATAAGDVVVKATAGGVDSANYTVSFAAAAPADIVPAAADKDTYSNASTGLKDAFGKDVTIDSSRSYGAAKFENVVLDDGEYVYKVFATGTNKATGLEETKSWDVVDGSVELTGASVSFIAIVRSATHTITSVVLKAFAK